LNKAGYIKNEMKKNDALSNYRYQEKVEIIKENGWTQAINPYDHPQFGGLVSAGHPEPKPVRLAAKPGGLSNITCLRQAGAMNII
jgi:hypothetical protein